MPDSMMAIISRVVATGRKMNGCDGFIALVRPSGRCFLPLPAWHPGPHGAGGAASDRMTILRALAQLVGAIDDDAVARHQPRANLDMVAIGDAELEPGGP